MLRVTIDLLPYGDESKKETLHTIDIVNDGTGSEWAGNYDVTDGEVTTRILRYARQFGALYLAIEALSDTYWARQKLKYEAESK